MTGAGSAQGSSNSSGLVPALHHHHGNPHCRQGLPTDSDGTGTFLATCSSWALMNSNKPRVRPIPAQLVPGDRNGIVVLPFPTTACRCRLAAILVDGRLAG